MKEYKIDFVVPWVDGSDINWREEKKKYSPEAENDDTECRYRDMELMKYWFRAVEEYAPWVNKVHFITCGHLPSWLNTECPKLNIVKHSDYIPEKYLPTFSSHPIELNLHRIKGLSEQFVYFNDDMFLNGSIEENFFFKNGKPCDYAYLTSIFLEDTDDCFGHICTNNIVLINREFSYIKSFLKHPFKYINIHYAFKNNIKNMLKLTNGSIFSGFENHHLPSAYFRKTLEQSWETHFDILDRTCTNRFRSPYDVNQYIFAFRQLVNGDFSPVNSTSRGKHTRICKDNQHIISALKNEKIKMICINDTEENIDFERAKTEIISAFEEKFPEKSSFEK